MFYDSPTISAAYFEENTKMNGRNWRHKEIFLEDKTLYYRIGGEIWDPRALGPERWFCFERPNSIEDIRACNLPASNPKTHLHVFYFDVPKTDPRFRIFISEEATTGKLQGKFPMILIPHIRIVKIINLSWTLISS